MAEMVDREGLLGGSAPPVQGSWVPQHFELEGGVLRWAEFDKDPTKEWPHEVPSQGALDAFLRIGSERDVLRFAQKWGPLMLCGHNQPCSHRRTCRPSRVEPIRIWLLFVELAKAMVAVAAAMRQGKPAPREAWETLYAARCRPDASATSCRRRFGPGKPGGRGRPHPCRPGRSVRAVHNRRCRASRGSRAWPRRWRRRARARFRWFRS